MTSTNDGKEVKSYQTSGPKGKTHYIELYKSLDARLNEASSPHDRTQHLCDAWRQVHTLCLHSASTTHPHLLSWLQRHTARIILQTKWQSPEGKDDRATLETAINTFITECQKARGERDSFQWETQLTSCGQWFKRISDRPWDHPVLSELLNPSGTPPTDNEVLSWLVSERGVTFVVRLQTLVAEKCEDIAAALTAAVMNRVRARLILVPDVLQTDDSKDKSKLSPAPDSDFGEKLTSDAGFTAEVWELLIDIEFVLLHKRDSSRCIALAKQTPLRSAYQLVERLQSRLELAPREKRLWKNAKDVAVLIAQVVITRCMVVPICAGASRTALYCMARSLAHALGPRLAPAAAALAAPAASARHLHTLATAVDAHHAKNNDQKMKPFVCELYVRAITAGMNELERLKIKTEKESEARQMEQTLSSWFVQLGSVFSSSDRIRCECTLTAFSVHPSMTMYERLKAAPTLPKLAGELESPTKEETCTSEFGSWASDSRSQTNFVKTSETLNMKQTLNQANVLSTALLNEGEALGLSPDLCHDIAVLLSGPRVKTLSWDMDREQLIEKCRVYMERTHGGTRALTTELKYLNLDPNEFMHLPEEEDDENDLYYGIEKGYEHLVQFQDPEDIWEDPERTASAHSTYTDLDTELPTPRRKKKVKKVPPKPCSDDETDPLSLVAENKRNNKKEQSHSKDLSKERTHSKERTKERKKKDPKDPLEIKPPKEKKEKPPKKEKEKKERKKKVKSTRESLAKLIGLKMTTLPSRPKKTTDVTGSTSLINDSDCDSQGKSSFTSVNSGHSDILQEGLFSMSGHPSNSFQNSKPVLDPYQKPVSFLSHSPNTVTDEVKKSLYKLIDNRRQKSPGNLSPEPGLIDLEKSITEFRSYKSMVSKSVQTPQRKIPNAITRPKTPLQTCISPKAVAIPQIPKSIINKESLINKESQRLDQIKNEIVDCLQKYPRNLNDTSIPSPVIQYAKKNDDTSLPYSNPFKMSDLVTVPQERYGPYDTQPIFTQSRSGPPVHRQPIRETPGQLSYQKFLEGFQRTADENYEKAMKKDIKPVSRVPPVIPKANKAETKTPKRAKPKPQQKKQDNSLNTFSRLSYMHKNKQADIKNNPIEPPAHGNVSRVSLENKIEDFVLQHLRKSSQNQSYPVDPSKILNEYQNARNIKTSGNPTYPLMTNMLGHPQIVNPNLNTTSPTKNMKPLITLNATPPTSYLSEEDQNDLIILLRQQNKQNQYHAPAPSSRPLNLKTYSTFPPTPPIISETSVSNHSAPATTAATISNTLKMPINENKQINIISTSIIKPATSAQGVSKTVKTSNIAKKNTKVDVQEKSKQSGIFVPRFGKAEVKKSEDWQAVMNAIRAQKTPIRGPNALDVALNKSSFEKAYENCLQHNEFAEQNSEIDGNTIKTDKHQLTKHSVGFDKHKSTKGNNRPKALNTSEESFKGVPVINKCINTKNVMQSKPHNINLSQKISVEHTKKKVPSSLQRGNDPFISGIPNSDYDLLEELMDDDLRKEIGELSSDEDYNAAATNMLKPTKVNDKRVSVIYNKNLERTLSPQKSIVANLTNGVQPQKCVYENKTKGTPKPMNQQYTAPSQPCVKVSTPNIAAPSCSSQTHVFSNINTYASNTVAVDPNVYISAVPHHPSQNMVRIGSNVAYEGYPNVQRPVAVTNMTPNAYVAVNSVPNITLYQSTQYAAPVINPVIIESAITMPVVSNMSCSRPVQTNAVNNSILSKYSTNKVKPSAQEYLQPVVAPSEVHETECKPDYISKEPSLINDHVKTDVNIPETNLNKNSERKVLSEVQEKQVFSQVQENQVESEIEDHKEKPKKIDYKKIIDQERLRKKRVAIMNRKIYHYSDKKPIALGYSPLFPVIQNTLSESELYCTNTEDKKPEASLEVDSPASQDSIDNCKENKDETPICRRILLRSSNKLKVKVPNDTSTNIVNESTTIEAPNIAKEVKTSVATISVKRPKRKPVSKQLKNKSIIKGKTGKKKPQRLKLNVNKKVSLKTKFKKVIDKIEEPVNNIDFSMDYFDIETQLVGAKIPKAGIDANKGESVSNDNGNDDKELQQSLSQNDTNIKEPPSDIDRDIKIPIRRSLRISGNTNSQPIDDIKETFVTNKTEVYEPILSDIENSTQKPASPSKDILNLPDVNIKNDGSSIMTIQTEQETMSVSDNNTLLDKSTNEEWKNIVPPQKLPILTESSVGNETQKESHILVLDKNVNDISKGSINTPTVTTKVVPIPVTKSIDSDTQNECNILVLDKNINKTSKECINTPIVNTIVVPNLVTNALLDNSKTEFRKEGNDNPTVPIQQIPKLITNSTELIQTKDKTLLLDKSKDDEESNTLNASIQKVPKLVTNSIVSIDSKTQEKCNNDGLEQKVEEIKKCFDSINTSNDKSVNEDKNDLTEEIKKSSNKLPNTTKGNEVEEKKDSTLTNPNDVEQLSVSDSLQSKTIITVNLNNTDQDDVVCRDVIKSTNDCSSVCNETENNVNLSDIPQSFKDSIQIDPIPNQISDDPLKKSVRIKLPNGRVFKATVYGQLNVDFDSLFAEPAIKSVLLNSLTTKKNFTLNVKQTTVASKHDLKLMSTKIRQAIPQNNGKIMETVNLLSDDEDEISQEFTTEFGKYKIQSIDTETHKIHQNKLKLKSAILLKRCDHNNDKSLPTNTKDLTTKLLPNDKGIQLTTPIDDVTESVQAARGTLKENVSSNAKINEEITNRGNEVYNKESEDDIVLIEDSSSEDELDNCNKNPEVINELANKLLIDLAVGVIPVPKMDDPMKLKDMMLRELGIEIQTNNLKETQIPEIDLTVEDSISEPISKSQGFSHYSGLVKECFIKLVCCDDLVDLMNKKKSTKNITDTNAEQAINIKEDLDDDVGNTDTKAESNDSTVSIISITDLDESGPKPRSRSNSFSILNDFIALNNVDIVDCTDNDRSSPVMEAFDLIASHEDFLKPKVKSSQVVFSFCDSDWFVTKKNIQSACFDACNHLQDVSPVIPLCCDSEWLSTKDIISKESMFNSSKFGHTVISNSNVKETTIIEVPSLTSLTLTYVQSTDLINNLQPITSGHNLMDTALPGTLKRKIISSSSLFTPKITKLNTSYEMNNQINSTDSDLTDMPDVNSYEESTTICDNNSMLLKTAECMMNECIITTVNEILIECLNTVIVGILQNKSNKTSSTVVNQHHFDAEITKDSNTNVVYKDVSKTKYVCETMLNYCNADHSDIIDVCADDIACTSVEDTNISAISGNLENEDCTESITNSYEETKESVNVINENMESITMKQSVIVEKCESICKLIQKDITYITSNSENRVDENIDKQLDIVDTCESKNAQTQENTHVVNDVITKTESVVCENINETTSVHDIIEMYAPKIAQDDVFVADVPNGSLNETQIKEITDVICDEIIKFNCLTSIDVDSYVAKERESIETHKSETTLESELGEDLNIPALSDSRNEKNSVVHCFIDCKVTEDQLVMPIKITDDFWQNVENNIIKCEELPNNVTDIGSTVLDTKCSSNSDLIVSDKLTKDFETIDKCIPDSVTELNAEQTASTEKNPIEKLTNCEAIHDGETGHDNTDKLTKDSKIIDEPIAACATELSAEETVLMKKETVQNLTNFKDKDKVAEENIDFLKEKPIFKENKNINNYSVSYCLEDHSKTNKCEDQIGSSPSISRKMTIADENIESLPNNTETVLTKYLKLSGEEGPQIILKGIEYEDPEAETSFKSPLIEQSTSGVCSEVTEKDQILNLVREFRDKDTDNKIKEVLYDTNLELIIPTNTYSKADFRVSGSLKRKRDMSDVHFQKKKYRKGKNIDYPKITVSAMNETVYVKEYKRLIDYYSTLKFSYSRPFHKEDFDIDDMKKDWPLRDVHESTTAEPVDLESSIFFEGVENDKRPNDPLEQTLAQELISEYNETEFKPSDITETNFSMGFGEGSGRVIQHSKTGNISKLSAATLSDVKPHQPYLSSEKSSINIDKSPKEKNDEKIKLKLYMNAIKLKQKLRSYFKKTATELTYDFLKERKKCSNDDTLNFPFGFTSTDFFGQAPLELVVNVVQVGQLPVSAAAQNPVTCDPRVTHVSNVSPSQCSAENSPGDDNQTSIKTEYTELTTADITLPLVQEYAQHHPFTSNDTQESSKTQDADHNICISTEINSEIKIELTEETSQDKMEENGSYESEPLPIQSGNNVNNGVPYIYNETPNNSTVESHTSHHTAPVEAKISNTFPESKGEENVNKTDQLAHAMNAAGITPSSNTINTTNADALVDIISQNAQSDVVTTTQINTNNYTKSTPINAMALQQALAQILPQPLSQTSTSESGQTQAPPVLHIVQGGNPQTVLNTQNGTPLLHIVQNKSATTSNGTPVSQANTFSGLSLVDTGLQQGGNQLLHIVNTGNQKNNNAGQLLKRVNLLTNIANVQGSNEQKMVQFVCKSADGKSIQLNAPHQRSMVLRLQPIDPSTIQTTPKSADLQDASANSGNPLNNKDISQQEIKSRSVYEENYAKFIQNGTGKPGQEKGTSLPKFNQVFGKQVSYQENKSEGNNDGLSENTGGKQNDNVHIEQINEMNNSPLLLRKSTAQTSQASTNLVQQIKQTIAPMNIQTMHGGVIYTRQIPVNIGGGQTINLITVPSTELVDDAGQKQQTDNKFSNQDGDHVIKIVQNQSNSSNAQNEDNNNAQMNSGNDTPQTPQHQPVLTQMRIKLPMLSKNPQMVSGARVVRPSFFQIQRNVIGGANQPVYQQLVLTTAPQLGQSIRIPAQAQPTRAAKPPESQSSPESQMSTSTLEQLREFDMVLEQVKERSTVQPGSSNSNSFSSIHSSADTTDSSGVVSTSVTETTQQVLYTTGNQTLNIASYVNRKSTVTSASSSFVRSPDSSGIIESPSSSTHNNHIPHTATSESTSSETPTQPKPKKKKSKPSSSATNAVKVNTTPPKTSTQKPLEDEQTTQRILYILAEYKEQVENSPDKDKPAPRRRNNLPTNASGSSKRKKSSSGSRRRDMSPILGEDSCRTMGSEDSSCGTSLGECAECMESHSPQESPRKVVRRLTFEHETTTTTQVTTQTRALPQRNVIVADGQTITVARGTSGKPATTVLMPANYLVPVSMMKGGQQIAIVTNRGPKLLVGGGEGATGGTLLFQRLIGPAGLKPVLTRPGVRHIRLPTAALQNLQTFNLAGATAPVNSTASPAPGPVPAPPDLVDSRAMSSPWPDRDTGEVKPERGSSPEGSEPWNLPSSSIADDYGYEEVVRTDNMDRTVLVVQRKDGRQHRLTHVSAAALRHKYAILEHELRLQKSLSEECEDLGVDSPSASELFPEAELLFAPSPVHEQTIGPCHTPQPTILNQVPQPDVDDQIATEQLLTPRERQETIDINLDDVGEIVTVGEDGMATISLDHEEFARSHPNTTFHTEPEDGEIPPFTIAQSIKGRQITFHASRGPSTVVMAPQTTVISQATVEASGTQNTVKFTDIDNMINSIPNTQPQMPSVLVKEDGLTRFDNILTDSRELHLSNTASAIVHSTGQGTQVIRRVRYDENRRESRYLIEDPMEEKIDDNRDLESMAGDNSSPERHPELFWESNSASEGRSEGRRRLDFSSDSDKCCKSPFDDSTDSSFGNHTRLDSVIKAARTEQRSGSDGSSDDHPPLRTYPAKRTHHHHHPTPTSHHHVTEQQQSLSGKTRAGERCMDVEGRRRASNRGVVKRGCHCCNGSPAPAPAPPKPKKSRQKKTPADFTNSANN